MYKIFSVISFEILIPYDRMLMQFLQGDSVFLMHLETAYPDRYGIIGHDKNLDVFRDLISDNDANFSRRVVMYKLFYS